MIITHGVRHAVLKVAAVNNHVFQSKIAVVLKNHLEFAGFVSRRGYIKSSIFQSNSASFQELKKLAFCPS